MAIENEITDPPTQSIGWFLVVLILLFSSLITLILFAGQLYFDYRRDVNAIEARFGEIESSHLESIGGSMWHVDHTQLRRQLEGIMRLPDMRFVEIREIPNSNDSLAISIGERMAQPNIVHNYNITYLDQGIPKIIGNLRIEATLENVYQRLIDKTLVILASQGIKTFLVSFFILYVVYYFFTRYLVQIAQHLNQYRQNISIPPLHLKRQSWKKPDEIDRVVEAINSMQIQLASSYSELRKSEERFRDFAESAADRFWEADENHRFTYMSSPPKGSGRALSEDMLGTHRWDFEGADTESDFWKNHRANLDAHRPFQDFEYSRPIADGKNVIIRCSGVPVFDQEGCFVGYRGTTIDITKRKNTEKALQEAHDKLELRVHDRTAQLREEVEERKRIEANLIEANRKAESANRTKSEFLANMSHELRTPLNAIIGFSETLSEKIFGPLKNRKQEEYVQDINESGRHLLSIINDILDLSAVELGKMELNETNFDIATITDYSRQIMQSPATKKGVHLSVKLNNRLPKIRGDELRIKQVLVNILSNAVKFTPEGGKVTVSAQHLEDGSIVFTVVDTGIGMDEEGMSKAIEKFGQVKNTLAQNRQGTGLGLPLSKELMQLHGGDLWIDSIPSKGTTVTVKFPPERVAQEVS